MKIKFLISLFAIVTTFLSGPAFASGTRELLNVSYDPTRELYAQYNQYFTNYWKQKTGEDLVIKQSHDKSGKQAKAVIDGLEADVVTLALGYDISNIAKQANLLPDNWQRKFSNNSAPYASTVVFLVREGNPKKIRDWNDLAKKNVKIITPNPKTSGIARWNYLAVLGYANKKFSFDQAKVDNFVAKLFSNVAVYDTGTKGSSATFTQNNIGDVLIVWESEALLLKKQFGDKFEIILPSISILAEPAVAVVDKIASKHNNTDLAVSYLDALYSEEGQEIIAQNFYRPANPIIAKKYEKFFPRMEFFRVDDLGGWDLVQKKYFEDGGVFDQIVRRSRL